MAKLEAICASLTFARIDLPCLTNLFTFSRQKAIEPAFSRLTSRAGQNNAANNSIRTRFYVDLVYTLPPRNLRILINSLFISVMMTWHVIC